MTFLNPFVLLGMLAAGIPLVLHLFNLRKLRTIEFSTLAFLKELQKTKIRRLKLRQILLLILRTLIVVLLVLAFSRPTVKGSIPGGLAEQAKTSAVIIVDDSYSMTAVNDHGQYIQQAKIFAQSILRMLKDGDEISLVRLSDARHPELLHGPQKVFSAVKKEIEEIQPSAVHSPLAAALTAAARILAVSKNFNKEVYCISDFQDGVVETDAARIQQAAIFSENVRFFNVPVGDHPVQNAAIESITIPQEIFEVHKPFAIKAKIANYGSSGFKNHVVSVFQDGMRVAEKSVDVEPGKYAEIEFSLVPDHAGFIEGYVALEDDDLDFDNKRYFTVNIPEQIKVCLIGSAVDDRYCKLALSTRLADSTAHIQLTEMSFDHFISSMISEADVLVVTSLQGATRQEKERLRAFVEDGGGIIFFPNDQIDIVQFNNTIAKPCSMTEIAGMEHVQPAGGSDPYLEFAEIDRRHPVFTGMFEEQSSNTMKKKQIESPRITTFVRLLPAAKSQTIIALSNRDPFLVEDKVGSGHVFLACVAPNTVWSDLPLKGLFVPLLHRSVEYLSQKTSAFTTITCGDNITLPLERYPDQQLIIDEAGKNQSIVQPARSGDQVVVKSTNTDFPGIYTLLKGQTKLQKFSVNFDPRESTRSPADTKMIARLFETYGIPSAHITMLMQADDVQRAVTEARLGTELWRPLLIAALLLAIIEMLVARDTKKALASIEA